LKGAQPIEFHYAVLPCTNPPKKTYSKQLLVVGDAAALISPLLGEGIRFCIEIGKIAGKVASQAVQSEISEKMLERYQKEWKERFGKYLSRSLKANKAAAKFSDQDWNSLIKYSAKFNEYPDIGLRFLRSEFSIRDLFKISPKFALKLGFKAI
jgi:digeranylgeranylglycerophospholipid reductase